jgi:hypothetical protein
MFEVMSNYFEIIETALTEIMRKRGDDGVKGLIINW